jgi:hypothetical protein
MKKDRFINVLMTPSSLAGFCGATAACLGEFKLQAMAGTHHK